MRAEKGLELLQLARVLAASGEGVPMTRLCEEFGVKRRTIERRMGAVESLFGPIERIEGHGRSMFYRLPGGAGDRMLTRIEAKELAELEHATAAAEGSDAAGRADLLRSLHVKLRASMRAAERNRIDVDLEALMESETLAHRPGPRRPVPATVLETLRSALLQGRAVAFAYEDRGTPFDVVPWGVLFGLRSYLVCAFEGTSGDPFLYRLDRMRDVRVLDRAAMRPDGFDLAAFAARSFGTFQEKPQRVVLRFMPTAAPDARTFLFHPTQQVCENEDGSVTIAFTAGGFRQIAHHLFTWGETVRIEEPAVLREEMRACLERAGAALSPMTDS